MKKVNIIIACFCLFAEGCNTFNPEDYDRNNTHDPKSEYFVPDQPEGLEINVQNGNIVLQWEDRSNYEDGYLIEKSITDTSASSFIELARLNSDTTTYTDRSHIIGSTSTYYRVTSFLTIDSALVRDVNQLVELKVPTLYDVQFNNEENQNVAIYFGINSYFVDGVLLEKKYPSQVDFHKVADLSEGARMFRNKIDNRKEQRVTYRLSSYQIQDNNKRWLGKHIETIPINYPIISSVSFINEKQTVIEWEDFLENETEFEVEKTRKKGVFGEFSSYQRLGSVPANSTSFTDTTTLRSGHHYQYRIRALKNGEKGAYFYHQKGSFYMKPPIMDAIGKTGNSAEVSWTVPTNDNPHRDKIAGFIIQRRTNGGTFQTVSEMDENTFSIINRDLNSQNRYTYRVKTLSSPYSSEVTLEYGTGYEATNSNTYSEPEEAFVAFSTPHIQILPQTGNLVISSGFVDYQNHFYNTIFIIEPSSLLTKKTFHSQLRYLSTYVSHNSNLVLQLARGSSRDLDLYIYNLSTGELVQRVQGVHTNPSAVVTHGKAIFNHDNSLTASFIHNVPEVRIWDHINNKLDYTISVDWYVADIGFHPFRNELTITHGGGIEVWDLDSFSQKASFSANAGDRYDPRGAIAFSETGNLMACSVQKQIFIIDTLTGDLINKFNGDYTAVHLAVNEKESMLARVNSKNKILLNDLYTMETVQIINTNAFDYPSFAFDPTGGAYSVELTGATEFLIKRRDKHEKWYKTINR